MIRPDMTRALLGQTSVQAPQWVHFSVSRPILPFSSGTTAPLGQTCMQAPQLTHRLSNSSICGVNCCDSGLLHHRQRRGQPFRKTVVRRPGPSCTDILWIL